MKTVFNSHQELSHIWAQQNQNDGRGGNMFFSGPTIYSYGHHFPVATYLEPNVILFTTASYSVSTAKHIGHVRNAIDTANVKIIYCDDITISKTAKKKEHKPNVAIMFKTLKPLFARYTRARQNKAPILNSINNTKSQIRAYTEYFKIKLTKAQNELYTAQIADFVELSKKEIEKQKQYSKKALKLEKKRKLAQLEQKQRELNLFLNGDRDIKTVIYRSSTNFLRISADSTEIETDGRAYVPIKAGKLLLMAIKAGRPVHGLKVGAYTVNHLIDNTLKIGCHTIDTAEIERFTPILEGVK